MQFIKQTPRQVNLSRPPYTCISTQVNTQGNTGPTGPMGYFIGDKGPTGPPGATGSQGPSGYPPFFTYSQYYTNVIVQPNSSYTVPINASLIQGQYLVLFNASITGLSGFSLTDVTIQYSGFNANYTNHQQFSYDLCSQVSEHSTHIFTYPGTPGITISTTVNPIQLTYMYIQFTFLGN